jgi:hypothetical protein
LVPSDSPVFFLVAIAAQRTQRWPFIERVGHGRGTPAQQLM